MIRVVIFFYCCIFSLQLHSQPQINNWFFSDRNGFNFSTGEAVWIPVGRITAMEGASAISDANGILLFYTDGRYVWNRLHDEMPGGSGLAGGNGSSTQSSLIVPKTLDGKQYYIFTTDEQGGPRGLQYSVVDMTGDGGKGAVTTLNTPLIGTTCEKVTAVRHCNKKDYWIITHQYGSDAYYAYQATETGVNPVPVISHTGSFIPVSYGTMAGALKASPDGKRLIANHGMMTVELSEFNNQTGVVSNTADIFPAVNGHPYGAEFSANSSKVYVSLMSVWDEITLTRFAGVYQFDLGSPLLADIRNSKLLLARYSVENNIGILARGPNGKIYMTHFEKMAVSVINNPNIGGPGCNYQDGAIATPFKCQFGFPNLIYDYNGMVDSFQIGALGSCANEPVSFSYNFSTGVNSIRWDFGDPASGAQNSSTLSDPTHRYSNPGPYEVKLIKFTHCGTDTLRKNIIVAGVTANLGPDRDICEGTVMRLDPQSAATNSFLWQDGSTLPTFSATQAGLYWVQVSSTTSPCIKRDSVVLTAQSSPVVQLGKDTAVCENQTIELDAVSNVPDLVWQDNSVGSSLTVNRGGIYWVEATLGGCKARDSVVVAARTIPRFSLGPDQQLCPGLSSLLSPGITANSYLWQDGSSGPSYIADREGLYHVELMNSCGTASDSIILFKGNCTIYVPTGFTPNNNGRNDLFKPSGTGLVNQYEMKIFDRSGQVVFVTQSKNQGWDGKFRGVDLPGRVYVYVIRYKVINDTKERILSGSVILIR